MRRTFNGPARTLRCKTHRDKWVTLYGLPSATAWCKCGREMQPSRTPSMRKKRG